MPRMAKQDVSPSMFAPFPSAHLHTALYSRGREGFFMRKEAHRRVIALLLTLLGGLAVPTRSGAYP